MAGLNPIESDPLGFFEGGGGTLFEKKNPIILSTFGFFQFTKIFICKTGRNKINAYAV